MVKSRHCVFGSCLGTSLPVNGVRDSVSKNQKFPLALSALLGKKGVVYIVEVWLCTLLSIVRASISLLWELYWWGSGVSGSFSSIGSLQGLGSFGFTLGSQNDRALTLDRYQRLYNCWGFHFIWIFHTISSRAWFLHRPFFRERKYLRDMFLKWMQTYYY